MKTKICKKCGLEKDLSEFSPRPRGKDGVNSKCKPCCSTEQTERYHSNPEIHKDRAKIYRIANLDECRIRENAYKIANPQRKLLDGSKYRAKKKGIINTLSMKDIIVPEFCPILGIKLLYSKGGVSDNSPSVDRIYPEKGYVPDNIRVISHKANRIKNNCSKQDLVNILKYIEHGI